MFIVHEPVLADIDDITYKMQFLYMIIFSTFHIIPLKYLYLKFLYDKNTIKFNNIWMF